MTAASVPPEPPPPVPAERRARFWRRQPLLFAVIVVALVVGGFLLGRGLWWSLRPAPEFPSLADAPDPELRGTVAFLKPYPNECIYLVAASGSPEEEVTCIDGGPGDLAWLPDGRLQSTRYKGGEGTAPTASWIIDVETGAVDEIPEGEIPPLPSTEPTDSTGPDGEVVTSESTQGTLTMTMTTSDGTRTLLKVGAPDTYTFSGPTWSADGAWFIVKDDLDRLLLVTTADPSTTRVLVDGGYAPAITDAELLSGS